MILGRSSPVMSAPEGDGLLSRTMRVGECGLDRHPQTQAFVNLLGDC